MLREFLLQQVGEGVAEAILLKIGPGDAGGVLLRTQVVILADLRAVLAPGDGGGIADLGRLRGQGSGRQGHGQAQRRGAQGKFAFHVRSSPFSHMDIPSMAGPDCSGCSSCRWLRAWTSSIR